MAESDTGEVPTGNSGTESARERLFRTVLLCAGVLIVAGTTLVATGGFIIDEMIYVIGAHAIMETGGFAFDNGWSEYRSPDLLLWLMLQGPNGIVPQYPPGTAILGAPLLGAFGIRGMILPNAIAASATLWIVYALARRVTGDATVAFVAVVLLTFATFFLEYAYGIWPHAMAAAAMLGAMAFTFIAHEAVAKRAALLSAAAGLLVGFGVTLRADAILVLPAIGAFVILYARAPFAMIASGAIGLLPPILLLSLANQAKFGTWNPLSYGRFDGGAVDLDGYLPLVALLVLALAGLVALRLMAWRPSQKVTLAGLATFLILGFAVPETRAVLLAAIRGIHVLVFDMTSIPEFRPGVDPAGEMTRLFWGLPKKALGQSLPWLGILFLLLCFGVDGERVRRWVVFSVIFIVVQMAPFVMRSWHGGLGLNTRYFLPVLPIFAILGAIVLQRAIRDSDLPMRGLLWAFLIGFAAVMVIASLSSEALAVIHQPVPMILFAATLAVTLLIVAVPALRSKLLAPVTLMAAAGIGMSVGLGPAGDFGMSQVTRDRADRISNALSLLPGPAVIYGRPETMGTLLERPDMLMAVGHRTNSVMDTEFINRALADGRRVLVEVEFETLDDVQGYASFSHVGIVEAGPTRFLELALKDVSAPN